MLQGKNILIGITGSIAAYKVPFLIRLLVKEGANVKVVMTSSACDFVTPLTLSALSQNPVSIEPFNPSDGRWHSHIELGSWADAIVIAPLSANTMAKMATGITDNLLMATYLAARCPVFFAPAMDVDMYHHPSTQENMHMLVSRGNRLIAPREGELASGLSGYGRMEEPEFIVRILNEYFSTSSPLAGKRIMVTSGPTQEPIDPVRYISNHSSGKMGNAIALEAAQRGASVLLISGPVSQQPSHPRIEIVNISSAEEMYQTCIENYPSVDLCIMAAAVADFTPDAPEKSKIKKNDKAFSLSLKPTKDILLEMGNRKQHQFLAGFALETNDEFENALKKLHTKNLDCIVLNSINVDGAGFNFDTNRITIIDKQGQRIDFDKKPKTEVASDLLDFIETRLPSRSR